MSSKPSQRRTWRWRESLLTAGIACLIVAAGYAAAFWGRGQRRGATTAAAAAERPAANFVLRDQFGRLTYLAQFRGRVVVLAFLDPDCTQICPLTSQILLGAMRRLGAAAARVQLLGINVNAQAATVADVAAYSRIHQMDAGAGGHWRFLTGSAAQLRRVWKEFGVYVATAHGDVVHQAAIIIIGPDGRERDAYITPMRYASVPRQAALLAGKIVPWLAGDPATPPPAAAPVRPPLPPAQPELLAALAPAGHPAGGAVHLGKGHPHLVCFFASWLGATTDLPRVLAQLDAYGRAARRHGWPPPVALDEMPTEPSAAEARAQMRRLAAHLTVSIAADTSGRIADGYGVQDLPWLALTDASGKIVWRHDGWLPAAALERAVARAAGSGSRLTSASPPARRQAGRPAPRAAQAGGV